MSRRIALGLTAAGALAASIFLLVNLFREGLVAASPSAAVVGALAGVLAAAAALWAVAPKPSAALPPELRVGDGADVLGSDSWGGKPGPGGVVPDADDDGIPRQTEHGGENRLGETCEQAEGDRFGRIGDVS